MHGANEVARFDGFSEMEMETGSERTLSMLLAGKRRDRCCRDGRDPRRCGRAHGADQRIPILVGHRDVGKQHIDLGLLQDLDGGG